MSIVFLVSILFPRKITEEKGVILISPTLDLYKVRQSKNQFHTNENYVYNIVFNTKLVILGIYF